ncbi:MAG: site-specific DNA-methyltransferase, partial [Chitinophagales bacterium]|nr:site-specific DNA-methyltransferase [Chitinophagales bacterium]
MKKIQSYKLSPAAGKKFLTYEGRNISDTMDLNEVKLVEEVLQKKNQLLSKNESSILEHQDGLLIHGDCISACAFLKSKNIKVDLIYVDPPFASGTNYAKKILLRNGTKKGIKISDNTIGNEVLYGDSWKKEDYLNWFAHRLLAFKEVMSEHASIFVHIDWHIGHYVKILLDEIFGENNFRNEIIWFYPSGAEPNEQFNRKHDTIFWYSKSNSKWTFNYDEVVIPYTKEQETRFDQWDEEKKKWFYWNVNPRGERVKTFKKAGLSEYDVWNIGINATEIRDLGYHTAKPQKLLEKIIKAGSNKNMVVADFFSGSGVAAKVAHDLGRKFIACDIGTNAMQTSRDRLVKAGASFSIYKIVTEQSIGKTIQLSGNKTVKKSVVVQSNDEV